MHGTDVGRLAVGVDVIKDIWSREGRYGERWLHGQVSLSLNEVTEPYNYVSSSF